MDKIDAPVNAQERYLHGINVRLDALIHMMSTFMDVYANQNNMATESNTVKEEGKPIRKSRKK